MWYLNQILSSLWWQKPHYKDRELFENNSFLVTWERSLKKLQLIERLKVPATLQMVYGFNTRSETEGKHTNKKIERWEVAGVPLCAQVTPVLRSMKKGEEKFHHHFRQELAVRTNKLGSMSNLHTSFFFPLPCSIIFIINTLRATISELVCVYAKNKTKTLQKKINK